MAQMIQRLLLTGFLFSVCHGYGPPTDCSSTLKKLTFKNEFDYPSFCDLNQLSMVPSAFKDYDVLQLNQGEPHMSGAVYLQTLVDVRQSFVSEFTFIVSNDAQPGQGDGFAFVVQALNNTAMGEANQFMGYGGMKQAVALEFDTFQNAFDPNGNHLALHYNPSSPHLILPFENQYCGDPTNVTQCSWAELKTDIQGGLQHLVQVEYDASNETFTVYIDSSECWQYSNFSFANNIDLIGTKSNLAYVGFTGATGGQNEQHGIRNWRFGRVDPSTPCHDSEFDPLNGCQALPSSASCSFDSCAECTQSQSCCGWNEEAFTCVSAGGSDADGDGLMFSCPEPPSINKGWWLGLAGLLVLITLVFALCMYCRRRHGYTRKPERLMELGEDRDRDDL